MHMRDAQLLSDLEMQPASSRSFISSSTKDLYFSGMVYGFIATGGPVVGRFISTKLVLPKSVGDLEMMHVNLLFNIVLGLCCISVRMFASCSCIGDLLLSCACVVFGSLSGLETLEVGVSLAAVAVFCQVPCH